MCAGPRGLARRRRQGRNPRALVPLRRLDEALHNGLRGLPHLCSFFSVPTEKCCPLDLARLRHLGFKIPAAAAPFSAFAFPYQVFVCSTRRSQTIGRDTLATLLSDRSLPPDAVTLCVADEEDVEQYRPCGLRVIVTERKGGGLPEQRSVCTRYLPRGSWALFLDDDVTSVARPDHLSLHELVMLGFLTAQQRRVSHN